MIWNELGVSGGTALIVLCAPYFVIKRGGPILGGLSLGW